MREPVFTQPCNPGNQAAGKRQVLQGRRALPFARLRVRPDRRIQAARLLEADIIFDEEGKLKAPPPLNSIATLIACSYRAV
jgi:hypothetical protein